jgi:type VI secretion system protein ImpC
MADVKIDVDPATHTRTAAVRADDTPFRIAIFGDFSGRANRGVNQDTAASNPIEIDPGNFEEVMERLGVELTLTAGDVSFPMKFRELDDFHPDHLYQSLPLFRAFAEARKELSKVKPAAPTAAPAPRSEPTPPPADAAPPAGGSLLDMIAAETPVVSAPPAKSREAVIDDAIRNIASKHATPSATPQQQSVLQQLDESASAAMRAILSHPDFQALEAAWRSIFLLFRHIDASVELKVYLIDMTRAELSAESLAKAIAGTENQSEPWSLMIGLYTFSPSERDCGLLARLASLGKSAGAPFLSAVEPKLFGCEAIGATPDPDDWSEPSPESLRTWQALRQSTDAKWVGLAMPRFLLRVPYGAKTSPIDSFDFEEMPLQGIAKPPHESYLWGNPAIICACLLGVAFNHDAWDMRPGSISRIGGIPIHAYAPGEITPPAEIWITERFAGEMVDRGVMPLASVKHSDEVMLVRFQSIADPPSALAGPW